MEAMLNQDFAGIGDTPHILEISGFEPAPFLGNKHRKQMLFQNEAFRKTKLNFVNLEPPYVRPNKLYRKRVRE